MQHTETAKFLYCRTVSDEACGIFFDFIYLFIFFAHNTIEWPPHKVQRFDFSIYHLIARRSFNIFEMKKKKLKNYDSRLNEHFVQISYLCNAKNGRYLLANELLFCWFVQYFKTERAHIARTVETVSEMCRRQNASMCVCVCVGLVLDWCVMCFSLRRILIKWIKWAESRWVSRNTYTICDKIKMHNW